MSPTPETTQETAMDKENNPKAGAAGKQTERGQQAREEQSKKTQGTGVPTRPWDRKCLLLDTEVMHLSEPPYF